MAGNFGPDNKRALDMGQTYTVSVRPGGRLRFRFSFEAYHENAVIIYAADTLEKITQRANSWRIDDEDWEFENREGANVGFVITGWHKDASWDAYLPWHQSRIKTYFATDKVVSVGFEDSPDDADFNDALVTVNIWPPPPPPPPVRRAADASTLVSMAVTMVAGVALGLALFRPVQDWIGGSLHREGHDE